ncbi:hypothetical protein EXU30_00105 [Shewanella maritima]|uniref:Uncharacterized protein n=1 Tax=Shewanella maritima TaxID=2520507 RepID=A0A411PCN1_9GAMM|nr:hypothetical protein [Shewanella maritima]QBF81271.1 hypothetical protein EXU30_00105 [Shewanella maritima]
MKARQLTPEQALRVTKSISNGKQRSQLNISDFDKNFSFATESEVKTQSGRIRTQFNKTIKELAHR